MSQEQPPIRSRRELRQARDERQNANPDTPGSAGTPGDGAGSSTPETSPRVQASPVRPAEPTEAETTGRRRIPGPVDSVRSDTAAERSSQVRARDRAALRTIKELAEKEGQLSPGGPPTRRQLRLQQLAEETAPATSANPIVPMPSPRTRSHPAMKPAAPASAPEPTSAPITGSAPTAAPQTPEGMSVEQALAARELLAAQARNQMAKMDHIVATDPDAVDPKVLAEQIALAERAAVLNRRAAAKQKLAEQNSQPAQRNDDGAGKQNNGPSTASNLAMVTPLEFVEVPGVERPVMKPPATSYVPLVTNQSPKVKPRSPRRPGPSRQRDAAPVPGRAGVLARAEAAAQAAGRRPAATREPQALQPVQDVQDVQAQEDLAARPPVAANAAYGLDPLDASTAGLGRARRLQMLQLGVLALGILALVAGIILIITGMGGH